MVLPSTKIVIQSINRTGLILFFKHIHLWVRQSVREMFFDGVLISFLHSLTSKNISTDGER